MYVSYEYHNHIDLRNIKSLVFVMEIYYISSEGTASVVYWSEFLATDPEARVRFPALPGKK
jgi:hypothetical protein